MKFAIVLLLLGVSAWGQLQWTDSATASVHWKPKPEYVNRIVIGPLFETPIATCEANSTKDGWEHCKIAEGHTLDEVITIIMLDVMHMGELQSAEREQQSKQLDVILQDLQYLQSASPKRSHSVRAGFQRLHPCPSTGRKVGACAGYVADHIKPLACGGEDSVANLQWQTIAEARAKDKWERKNCKK